MIKKRLNKDSPNLSQEDKIMLTIKERFEQYTKGEMVDFDVDEIALFKHIILLGGKVNKETIEEAQNAIDRKPFKGFTWKDEAIRTIVELEKQGINLYDPNRRGGMYLRRRDGTSIASDLQLKEKFKRKEVIHTEETEVVDTTALKNFFNNNK